MKKFEDYLYSRLPEFYRYEDAQQSPSYPLKRFLQILGSGMNYVLNDIETFVNKFNIDTCHPSFLPHIAKTLGLEFPYNVPIEEQRKFLKNIVTLYTLKGTATSFNFIGQQVFGDDTFVDVFKPNYVEGMTSEEYNKLFLKVTANGENFDIAQREENFFKWVELIRPSNTIIMMDYNLFYKDSYLLNEHCYIQELPMRLTDLIYSDIKTNQTTPQYPVDVFRPFDTDYYKLSDLLKYENYFMVNKGVINNNPLTTIYLDIQRPEPTDSDDAFMLNYHETNGSTGILLTPATDIIKNSPEEDLNIHTKSDGTIFEEKFTEGEETFNLKREYTATSTSTLTRAVSSLVGTTLNSFYLTSIPSAASVSY